jgi:hypothetical protein
MSYKNEVLDFEDRYTSPMLDQNRGDAVEPATVQGATRHITLLLLVL